MEQKHYPPTDGIRKVIEAEIINPDEPDAREYRTTYTTYSSRPGYSGVFTVGSLGTPGGCTSPAISLGIFLACLIQYGLLAAIGFAVFCTIGSVIGTVREARALMAGKFFNPWAWRVGNWFVSFLLTYWLAGGFNG